MPTPNRSVVVISGLLTLLVLAGASFAVALRTGAVHLASTEPRPDAVATLAEQARIEPAETAPSPLAAAPVAPGADAAQAELALYRGKLDEAYRALDEAYAQVRALQAAQSQPAPRAGGRRGFAEHDREHEGRERDSRRDADDD